MKISEVEKLVNKLKLAIECELNKSNYDNVLKLISVCSNVLYQTNIKYMDEDLEQVIAKVAKSMGMSLLEESEINENTLLFWDGFGLNSRGLASIYIKALCKIKHVVYVTYVDRKEQIPDIQRILNEYGAERYYVDRNKKTILEMINQLNVYIQKVKPSNMFFYSTPDDVVATPLMYAYEGIITRYQINLTDHAFWIAAGCCDKCISFRNYGAKIAREYRNISENKNVVIPFYPIINYEKEFEDYPFKLEPNQKIIFSGGQLYKTLGEGNKYYDIVDHILDKHKNVIFWYAGDGDDTELRKIIYKYPNRAYFTSERSDLYQVLEHCDVYLSTYPMCGGLMFQYAAMAGKVPITLKHGNISDDFLLNQKNINIEFDSVDDLFEEVDKILSDDKYAKNKSKLMKKSVISPDIFEGEVKKLIYNQQSEFFRTEYEHIDTESFRQWYLQKIGKKDLYAMIVRRNAISIAIKHYPLIFLRGGIYLVEKLLIRHLGEKFNK